MKQEGQVVKVFQVNANNVKITNEEAYKQHDQALEISVPCV